MAQRAPEAPTEAAAPQTPETQTRRRCSPARSSTPSRTGRVAPGSGGTTSRRRRRRPAHASGARSSSIDARSVDHKWLGRRHVRAPQRARCRRRSCAPSAPTPGRRRLLEGDVVSWGQQGRTVIAGRRGRARDRVPALGLHRLGPGEPRRCASASTRTRRSAATCSRSGPTTSARCSRWIGTAASASSSPGIGRIHRVLDGYAMVAVSALSDMIVVPQASLASLPAAPLATGARNAPISRGAGLYFEGSGEGETLAVRRRARPVRDRTGARVVAERLATPWSWGARRFRRGFYLLDTAGGDGLDAPQYVGPTSGIPYGTITSNDVVIVETAEGVFTWTGGDLVRIQAPPVDPSARRTHRVDPLSWHTRCDEHLGRRRGTRGDRDGGAAGPRRASDRRRLGSRSHP